MPAEWSAEGTYAWSELSVRHGRRHLPSGVASTAGSASDPMFSARPNMRRNLSANFPRSDEPARADVRSIDVRSIEASAGETAGRLQGAGTSM
jgi:hypothetical protein